MQMSCCANMPPFSNLMATFFFEITQAVTGLASQPARGRARRRCVFLSPVQPCSNNINYYSAVKTLTQMRSLEEGRLNTGVLLKKMAVSSEQDPDGPMYILIYACKYIQQLF